MSILTRGTVMSLEDRIKELESKLNKMRLECKHEWEIVGGKNNNLRLYFNMCNTYIRCAKCGWKQWV